MCPHTAICVLIPRYTAICVLIHNEIQVLNSEPALFGLYMCPHTAIYCYMCPHTQWDTGAELRACTL
jgi:hypothetical protein